jgi:tetratricopeptide (TPR) repeat protein
MTATGIAGVRTYRAWLIFLAVLFYLSARCQTANRSGAITGTVRNADGKGIAGAVVLVSEAAHSDAGKRALTDANGRYAITGIAYGAYQLSARANDFNMSGPKLVIVAKAASTIDFTLTALADKAGADNLNQSNTGRGSGPPPVFSAAGVEGTIAPPGYSTGLSSEETSNVMQSVNSLDRDVLAGILPAQGAANCDREAQLLQAAQAEPGAFGPNYALGDFYLDHGEFVRSIKFLKVANQASPSDAANARELALALIGAQQDSEAVALLERMIESGRSDPVLLRILAIAYEETGNRQKAISAYQQSAHLDPGAKNQFDCGMGLIALGASTEAAELLSHATASHPESARLWMGLGVAQDLQQRRAEAVHSLLRATDTDPDYLPSYAFLAGLADAEPHALKQIRSRLAALVISRPESAAAHYDYALALWKQHTAYPGEASVTEIETQLKLALAKDPTMARAYFQLGIVYSDSGEYVNAESEFEQAVKLEPENAEAHYRLAQVYSRNRKPQPAQLQMKQFLALRGVSGRDENSPEADLQRLGSHLSQDLHSAAPCDSVSH